MREVNEVVDWHQLGSLLGIKRHELDSLQQMYQYYGPDRIKAQIFGLWLKRDLDASWEALVTALENMKENVVARRVAEKYCGRPYTPGEGANFYMYA